MREHIKYFTKKGIIFLVLFFVLLIIINQMYIKLILNEKNIYRNHEQFVDFCEFGKCKILFFGDSHPATSINPEYVPSSFNFAIPSETHEQTYYKVKWVIENKPEVEIFVLPYDVHTFSNYRSGNRYYDERYWINFMSYDQLSKLEGVSKIGLFLKLNFPVIGKGEEILTILFSSQNRTNINLGWQEHDGDFSLNKNTTYSAINRVNSQFPRYPNFTDQALLSYFIQIIDLLNANNKTVFLIKYPLTDEYFKALENKGLNITTFYLESDKKFSSNDQIEVLDYQKKYKFNQSLFYDPDHLNKKGAMIFSKRILIDILEDNRNKK